MRVERIGPWEYVVASDLEMTALLDGLLPSPMPPNTARTWAGVTVINEATAAELRRMDLAAPSGG